MIVCLVISCYPFFVETIYYAISSAILLLYIFPTILKIVSQNDVDIAFSISDTYGRPIANLEPLMAAGR